LSPKKTYAAGDGGKIFSPPNAGEGELQFPEALSRLRSSNQQEFKKAAGQVLSDIGVQNFEAHDAIGDWEDGAENSLVHSIRDPMTPEQSRYAASFIGSYGKQKSVLVFHTKPQGPDAVYEVHTNETNTDRLREGLTRSGIKFRSIIPHEQGGTVLVYDKGRQLAPNVQAFAKDFNATVYETSGSGYEIGGPTREQARAKYRDTIRETEAAGLQGRHRPPEGHPLAGFPEKLSRQAPAGTGQVERGIYYPPGEFIPDPV
jgi:hypothetical protein